ncbi:MAG: 1-phosphofructokinase family hexose kinase [Stackebrandtia sp.]
MILTVALNAALDVTYTIDAELRPYATHRVGSVELRAGGKALNTARVLHSLGEPVLATGLLGGVTGDEIAARIPAGLPHSFTRIAAESRRAVVVADAVGATGFWEPGPQANVKEWHAFLDHYEALLRVAEVVVLSGSIPGILPGAYTGLVRAARFRGVDSILDCDGPPLVHAAECGPTVVKPNAEELADAFDDLDTSTLDGVVEAANRLRAKGAEAVVASRGADGLIAVTPEGSFTATPPEVVTGNPTGAGDACNAALARGIRHATGWPQRLREAVALSAAAVKSPVAGQVDTRDYLKFRHHVHVKEL